jgi:glutathione S-transferase
MTTMILYENRLSPYAFKVRVFLAESGVAFDSTAIRSAAQRAELLRVNPRGEVPALVDGDHTLADSPLICRYLAELHGCGALYPSDPRQRFAALAVERYSDTQVDAALFAFAVIRDMFPGLAATFPGVEARIVALLETVYDQLERRLAGASEYFAGAFSIADIAVIPHVATARAFGHKLDRARWPQLSAWSKRTSARPHVREALVAMGQEFAASKSQPDPMFTAEHLHVRNDRIEALVRVGLGSWLVERLQSEKAFLSDP